MAISGYPEVTTIESFNGSTWSVVATDVDRSNGALLIRDCPKANEGKTYV